MGWIIWLVVLGLAAKQRRFLPNGLYLILGTSTLLMLLSAATHEPTALGETADLSDPEVLAFNFAIKLATTSVVVAIGFVAGKLYRRRSPSEVSPKEDE